MISIDSLKKYEYISFDIFDTLIVRNVCKPSDIFDVIECEYNKTHNKKITNFKTKRIEAEKQAFEQRKNEEITINEIYKYIDFPENMKKEIIELEKNSEMNLCQTNREMIDIYNWCIKNKMVVITSDMYLDRETIENILKKNGINSYKKLYLSSDVLKTKVSGNLFEYIIDDLKIDKQKIVHIGDNKISDYKNPKTMGISAIQYKKTNFKNNAFESISSNILNNYIYNNIKKSNCFFFNFGYSCIGPVLYGFVRWLDLNLKKLEINKVFFLSRDGYIIKKAFDLLKYDYTSQYIFASRRSVIVPSFRTAKSMDDILKSITLYDNLTVKKFIRKVGLDDVDITNIMNKYSYNLESILDFKNISEQQISFFNDLYPLIVKNATEEHKYFRKYLDEIHFNKKIAIVDIGWYGTMQNAYKKIIKNIDIYGFYFGNKNNDKDKFGFLFNKGFNYEIENKLRYINAIFEFCFLAQHGSVKRFSASGVEFYDYEYSKMEVEKIQSLQDGALEFIKDINNSDVVNYIEFNADVVSSNLMDFALNPSKESIEEFGKLDFYDDITYKLIKNKSKMYYLFHPLKLKKDFNESIWKPGFIKKIFGINYSKIYAIKKHKEK